MITPLQILEGIIIGVSGGLITSLIIGAYQWIKYHIEKRKQMKFIAQFIQHSKHMVFVEPDLIKHQFPDFSIDSIMQTHFYAFVEILQVTLNQRTSSMTFDQVMRIKTLIYNYIKPPLESEMQGDKKEFEKVFENLESVDWIKKRLK